MESKGIVPDISQSSFVKKQFITFVQNVSFRQKRYGKTLYYR